MPKFKKGDRVRVRLDSASTFRGRIGLIDRGPVTHPNVHDCFYMVRFGEQHFLPTTQFAESELEAVPN